MGSTPLLQVIHHTQIMDSCLLREAALKLSAFERAQLIDVLWQSLDSVDQTAIDQAWLVESQDRLSAFQQGEIEAVDGATALSALKDQLAP
jgi:putative addiction module component (TIGR02574 family)